MKRIAHIINPVIVPQTSDLFAAQPVTFETMRTARHFARRRVDVTIFSAQFPEDHPILPAWVKPTPDLDRSILDLGLFKRRRRLPLLKDILDRLYEATEAEYLIYTNVDIALMPDFYLAVDKFIESDLDAFVINRRTIPGRYKSIAEIPLMYSEVGEPHPGYDCFVFRRDAYPGFRLGEVCLGVNWVGMVLILNLACHAKRFREFKDRHLTFHIGNDKVWKSDEHRDYVLHNKGEAEKVLFELETGYGPFDEESPVFPYISGFDIERAGKRGVGTSEGSFLSRFGGSIKKAKQRLKG